MSKTHISFLTKFPPWFPSHPGLLFPLLKPQAVLSHSLREGMWYEALPRRGWRREKCLLVFEFQNPPLLGDQKRFRAQKNDLVEKHHEMEGKVKHPLWPSPTWPVMAGPSEGEWRPRRKERKVLMDCKPETDVEAEAQIQEVGFKGTREWWGLWFPGRHVPVTLLNLAGCYTVEVWASVTRYFHFSKKIQNQNFYVEGLLQKKEKEKRKSLRQISKHM